MHLERRFECACVLDADDISIYYIDGMTAYYCMYTSITYLSAYVSIKKYFYNIIFIY